MKKCRYCKFLTCTDESDVSGLDCSIVKVFKITDVDRIHCLCRRFEFSLIRFLFGI
jgi:hypothetical protein